MSRIILPLSAAAVALWVSGGLLGAGLQVAKVYSDRLAVTVCEASQVTCR